MLSEDLADHEVCAVCGKDVDGGQWFCHFYQGRSRITLCTPKCADAFLHQGDVPDPFEDTSAWSSAEVARAGS